MPPSLQRQCGSVGRSPGEEKEMAVLIKELGRGSKFSADAGARKGLRGGMGAGEEQSAEQAEMLKAAGVIPDKFLAIEVPEQELLVITRLK